MYSFSLLASGCFNCFGFGSRQINEDLNVNIPQSENDSQLVDSIISASASFTVGNRNNIANAADTSIFYVVGDRKKSGSQIDQEKKDDFLINKNLSDNNSFKVTGSLRIYEDSDQIFQDNANESPSDKTTSGYFWQDESIIKNEIQRDNSDDNDKKDDISSTVNDNEDFASQSHINHFEENINEFINYDFDESPIFRAITPDISNLQASDQDDDIFLNFDEKQEFDDDFSIKSELTDESDNKNIKDDFTSENFLESNFNEIKESDFQKEASQELNLEIANYDSNGVLTYDFAELESKHNSLNISSSNVGDYNSENNSDSDIHYDEPPENTFETHNIDVEQSNKDEINFLQYQDDEDEITCHDIDDYSAEIEEIITLEDLGDDSKKNLLVNLTPNIESFRDKYDEDGNKKIIKILDDDAKNKIEEKTEIESEIVEEVQDNSKENITIDSEEKESDNFKKIYSNSFSSLIKTFENLGSSFIEIMPSPVRRNFIPDQSQNSDHKYKIIDSDRKAEIEEIFEKNSSIKGEQAKFARQGSNILRVRKISEVLENDVKNSSERHGYDFNSDVRQGVDLSVLKKRKEAFKKNEEIGKAKDQWNKILSKIEYGKFNDLFGYIEKKAAENDLTKNEELQEKYTQLKDFFVKLNHDESNVAVNAKSNKIKEELIEFFINIRFDQGENNLALNDFHDDIFSYCDKNLLGQPSAFPKNPKRIDDYRENIMNR